MTPLSNTILHDYQMRKTTAQKSAFIQLMQSNFPDIHVEEDGRFLRTRNLILGDINQANYVFSAHYDTCAELPFPNFIAPQNFLLLIVQILSISFLFTLLSFLLSYLGLPLMFISLSIFLLVFLLQLWMLFGKANPHTCNDNTSGVLTLCEAFQMLNEEEKKRIAFVFFDHEELGLIGSHRFLTQYSKAMKNKLLLNFDCVSDGEHILLCLNKSARKNHEADLKSAFEQHYGKQLIFSSTRSTFYPSDHIIFPINAAVATLNKKPLIGLYLSRIHTKHDTVFQEENIILLATACKKLALLSQTQKITPQ